jgi:hypothetical protein
MAAITKADGDEAAIGSAGMGVPALRADGEPALIHVLPLMRGDIRARIAPRASAALFVTPAGDGFAALADRRRRPALPRGLFPSLGEGDPTRID